MIRILERIWNDIRKGENIDLYVTIVVAIALATLNLLGTAIQSYIAPVTLAVLALLAITSLGNRHRIEELLRKQSISLDNFYMKEYPSNYQENLVAARELWILGVTLHRTIQENYAVMEQKLVQGHHIKVLLIHPEGPGIEMAVQRNYTLREVGPQSSDTRVTLQLLCRLVNSAPDRIEVRTIQFPLAYGATVINPNAATGVLYLEHYCFRSSPESWPRLVLQASDGQWYDFFLREIEALWAAGVEWPCNENNTTPDTGM